MLVYLGFFKSIFFKSAFEMLKGVKKIDLH